MARCLRVLRAAFLAACPAAFLAACPAAFLAACPAAFLAACPAAFLAACATPGGPGVAPSGRTPMDDHAAGELSALAREYWTGYLEANPESATLMGDHRFDDRLSDVSPAGIAREEARHRDLLERLRRIDAGKLSRADRVTYRALEEELSIFLDTSVCRLHEWTVSTRSGPHIDLANLAELTPVRTPEDARNMLARFGAAGAQVDQMSANLRTGKAAGRVAPRSSIDVAVRQLDELLADPVEQWAMAKPGKQEHGDWPAGERDRFDAELRSILETQVRPALERHRDLLAEELRPVSRDADRVGLRNVPGGLDCYERLIRAHTSLAKPAEEVHRLGLDEVARLREELSLLGGKTLGTTDVAEIQRRLRTDPELHFRTREEVEEKASAALKRARDAMPKWFGRLPKAPCEVVRIPDYEEKDTTIAYYRQPSMDGARPGHYYINTYAPETRPRYEAEVLAYHESIPGHHLQIAIAQELPDLPDFRRHGGSTAFVEGWGLYTERLADEMGLYSSDVDRLGVLSFDLWRACRLVVDTGIHARGWSRDQGIRYMVDNTLLAENNVVNEVDRYINWPGQALAYKLGQIEILKLRAEAQEKLGSRFDIRGFHDVVLSNGALSLPALRGAVEDWVAASPGAP